MRRAIPSTCGWIVVERSERTVATNSDVRGTGLGVSVMVFTSVGGMAPAPGAPAWAFPRPLQPAQISASGINMEQVRAMVMVYLQRSPCAVFSTGGGRERLWRKDLLYDG